MTVRTNILGFLLAGLLITGCASTPAFRAHPQLDEKLRTIEKVIVMPTKIDVYQLTAGGEKEKIDEWTTEAQENVMAAIEEELRGKSGFLFKSFSEDALSEKVESNLEDTWALFDAVNESIVTHTYSQPQQLFSEKIKNFDYSVGPEVKGLADQADALLFVRGVDYRETKGRQALQGGVAVLAFLLGVIMIPEGGFNAISIALVDVNTGSILWYDFLKEPYDLRDPTSVTSLVRNLLENFPIR